MFKNIAIFIGGVVVGMYSVYFQVYKTIAKDKMSKEEKSEE